MRPAASRDNHHAGHEHSRHRRHLEISSGGGRAGVQFQVAVTAGLDGKNYITPVVCHSGALARARLRMPSSSFKAWGVRYPISGCLLTGGPTGTNLTAMTDATTGPEADARRAALLALINGDPTAARIAQHSSEVPPETDSTPASVAPVVAASPSTSVTHWSLIVAIIWALASVIVGLVFIFGVHPETYGGDAYTGIEAAIVTAVHAVGWLIIGSGVLGLLVAGIRVSRPG